MELLANLLILLYLPTWHTVSGNVDDSLLEIQPVNPKVRESDDVTITCFSPIPGTLVSWFQGEETTRIFQTVERYSFPGGSTMHLRNASRIPGDESSSVAFLCGGRVNDDVWRRVSTVTVIASDSPMAVTTESSLVIFPSNPVAQNGTDITLTCLAPSENTSDIGWYVPGESLSKFERDERHKFDNGANITLTRINVDSAEAIIRVVCLKNGDNFITKAVDVLVTETVPTTVLPTKHKGSADGSTMTTISPTVLTTFYSTTTFVRGIPLSLVLTAIGIGAGLAVFMICLILLSVYVLVVFRSQGWGPFKSSYDVDDVFKPTARKIDTHHPYQSVGDKDDASRPRGVGSKDSYADLRQYEEPRLYMRLESQSAPKPHKQEHAMPEAIYDGGDPTAVQMVSFRNTDSKEASV